MRLCDVGYGMVRLNMLLSIVIDICMLMLVRKLISIVCDRKLVRKLSLKMCVSSSIVVVSNVIMLVSVV